MPSHHHSHEEKESDIYTNASTALEAVTSFVSNTFWIGGCIDTTGGLDEDFFGLSYYGLVFGALIAILSAGGAAYSHRIINTIHQGLGSRSEIVGDEKGTREAKEAKKQEMQLTERTSVSLQPKNHLNNWQYLALIGDSISHAGEVAGPIYTAVLAGTKNNLLRWNKAILLLGATAAGAIGAYANVRACKNAMMAMNSNNSAPSSPRTNAAAASAGDIPAVDIKSAAPVAVSVRSDAKAIREMLNKKLIIAESKDDLVRKIKVSAYKLHVGNEHKGAKLVPWQFAAATFVAQSVNAIAAACGENGDLSTWMTFTDYKFLLTNVAASFGGAAIFVLTSVSGIQENERIKAKTLNDIKVQIGLNEEDDFPWEEVEKSPELNELFAQFKSMTKDDIKKVCIKFEFMGGVLFMLLPVFLKLSLTDAPPLQADISGRDLALGATMGGLFAVFAKVLQIPVSKSLLLQVGLSMSLTFLQAQLMIEAMATGELTSGAATALSLILPPLNGIFGAGLGYTFSRADKLATVPSNIKLIEAGHPPAPGWFDQLPRAARDTAVSAAKTVSSSICWLWNKATSRCRPDRQALLNADDHENYSSKDPRIDSLMPGSSSASACCCRLRS